MEKLHDVVLSTMEALGTPRSLTAWLLYKYGEVKQLQELRVDPLAYDNARLYWLDQQASAFLKKTPFPGDELSRYEAAVSDFLACEKQNCLTNARLNRFIDEQGPFEPCDGYVIEFVTRWRKEFRRVLGKLPKDLSPTFSGGATVSDPAILCTAPDKMTSRPSFYPKTASFLPFWAETAWGRAHMTRFGGYMWPTIPTKGNIFFTVPKDGTKDRGCCKEANVSLGYQLPTGKHIRGRIKSCYGYDIKYAKPDHMRLAMLGSIAGVLCTLDLKSASNSLVYNLVKLLASDDWFAHLDALRAPFTLINKRWYRLEMFSSMGNGFTFELETLVFWSLARTVCEMIGSDPDAVRCFGDDLIAPNEAAPAIIAALKFAGFTTNEQKSFSTGWFRESCGGDYFRGQAVRPYYLDKLPTEPQHWISMHNGIKERFSPFVDVTSTLAGILNNIPSDIRSCRGPAELGDIVIHADAYRTKIRRVSVPGCEPLWSAHVRAYVPCSTRLDWHHWWPEIQLASALIGESSEGVTPRDVSGYRLTWVQTPGSAWLPM